ncbi:MAG: hypothetical protein HC881_20480 [Leptolyngbyaceae cyanobacterium SL_7_1]|nr:hypothetical protein [Leptolyngbyaceae cyanobacterium SL_7_1]
MAVKLTDIIYSVSSYYRGVENLIRHPFEMLFQQGRRVAQEQLEQVDVPLGQRRSHSPANANPPQAQERSPHQPAIALSTAASDRHPPTPVRHRQVPLSPEQVEIRGRWGRYRRVSTIAKVQEHARWYDGILVPNHKPVLIKEYLLSERNFSPSEIRERKQAFALLSNLNWRQSGGQDFRLVRLYEARLV